MIGTSNGITDLPNFSLRVEYTESKFAFSTSILFTKKIVGIFCLETASRQARSVPASIPSFAFTTIKALSPITSPVASSPA